MATANLKWLPRQRLGRAVSKVFVSYRRDDCPKTAEEIYDFLAGRLGGVDVFFDSHDIPLGSDIDQAIHDSLSRCSLMLAVVGPQWVERSRERFKDPEDYILLELRSAVELGIRVIPVLVGGASMPKESELPNEIRPFAKMNAAVIQIDDDGKQEFEQTMNDLVRGMRPDLGGRTLVNSIGMKLAPIPDGEFWFGRSAASGAEAGQSDGFRARISRPCYMGVYPVTQREFEKVMERQPSCFAAEGPRGKAVVECNCRQFPVENLSWSDASEFCRRLSALEAEQFNRRTYELPTEAEWEHACRGGASAQTEFHFGDTLSSTQANFNCSRPYGGEPEEYLGRPTEVGSYGSNLFGLHDMHGNVWEWCADRYTKDTADRYRSRSGSVVVDPSGPRSGSGRRILRGGSWNSSGAECRSWARSQAVETEHRPDVGLRVLCRRIG